MKGNNIVEEKFVLPIFFAVDMRIFRHHALFVLLLKLENHCLGMSRVPWQ